MSLSLTPQDLLDPRSIRSQSRRLFDRALMGKGFFEVNLDRLESCAQFTVEVIRENYPEGRIPFHSRLRHFEGGRIDRLTSYLSRANGDKFEEARLLVDLIIPSVLLDAGSGPDWKLEEVLPSGAKQIVSRSEGLAIASLALFRQGLLDGDSSSLREFDLKKLETGFQVGADNPLAGTEGRVGLLNALGAQLEKRGDVFGSPKGFRPGGLVEWAHRNADSKRLPVVMLFSILLETLGPIWPKRHTLSGVSLGDAWPHAALGARDQAQGFVPFHKLTQWLTYSLIEPLERSGLKITDLDQLTGLPEYRNGGLFLDTGVIGLRDPGLANQAHTHDSELVVEWRALTVTLLDELVVPVRRIMGVSAEDFPLVCMLEGGSWWAGRKSAAKLRPGGSPPLQVVSDGTVF